MGSTTLLHPVFNNLEQVIIFCRVPCQIQVVEWETGICTMRFLRYFTQFSDFSTVR